MFLLIVIKNYLSAAVLFIISLIPTLKPQSNGPLYSNVVIGMLYQMYYLMWHYNCLWTLKV